MRSKNPDYVFLGLAGALLLLGFVLLTSASGPVAIQKFGDAYWYVKHQALFGLLPGALLFYAGYRIDYRFWRTHAGWLFAASLLLLLLALIPGVSGDWSASRSWIHVGGFSLQPVELVKLTLVIFLAAWFEAAGDRGIAVPAAGLLPFLAATGAAALLIVLQPDLGSLMVVAAAALTVYFAAGAPWLHLAGLGGAGGAALWLLVKTAPYRTARLMTFLHPELDPQGIGYHINQAFLAIGSGGWIGLGLGHSRQKYLYLPEVVGDSIFAVAAEELGFVVTLAILALFAVFFWRMIRIAADAPDDFGRLTAAGIAGWIFFQTMFNIGSMVGIMPITGLPLPFVSYGGTALMVLLGAVGVLANISSHAAPRPVRRR